MLNNYARMCGTTHAVLERPTDIVIRGMTTKEKCSGCILLIYSKLYG